jgi:hypothetical protein
VLLDDLAGCGLGRLEATAVLADELLQAFGYPENGLVTRAGDLRAGGFTVRNCGAVAADLPRQPRTGWVRDARLQSGGQAITSHGPGIHRYAAGASRPGDPPRSSQPSTHAGTGRVSCCFAA